VAFLVREGVMVSRNNDWYDKASDYWNELPETQYLNESEVREIYPVFLDFLADTMNGSQPEESLAFQDLLNYFGWDYETFDWDDFREWYDSL
jgi:hypothetical protein